MDHVEPDSRDGPMLVDDRALVEACLGGDSEAWEVSASAGRVILQGSFSVSQ